LFSPDDLVLKLGVAELELLLFLALLGDDVG
jgi:hypothetical protein